MSRTSALILLGILTILTPFSGLPIALRTFLVVVFGACVAAIGLMLRTRDAQTQKQSAEASLSPTPSQSSEPEPTSPAGVSPI